MVRMKMRAISAVLCGILLLVGCGSRSQGQNTATPSQEQPTESRLPEPSIAEERGATPDGLAESTEPDNTLPSASSSDPASEALSDQTENTAPEQSKAVPLDALLNGAVDKIGSLTRMPEEAVGAVQSYGTQMGWMEANQITNLERYTPITGGEYFLIVPQYIGSTVIVESLNWEGTDAPKVMATTYMNESTPDDFALILDTAVPESAPLLQVIISYGNLTGTYLFAYDGRGGALPELNNGIYRTEYDGFTKPNTSNPSPAPTDNPGFQSGAGTHDRSGVFFVEHNPSAPDKAQRVDYVVKLPYEWTKEFKYPDSEYAQYFFTGEYLVRFEGYYWDGSPLNGYLDFSDTAQTVTLGTKTVYVERLRSGDSVFNEYFFAMEDSDFYVKAVLYPYLHSLDDPALTYTQTLDELDEEVRLMIASFSITKQTSTLRPF